MHWASGSPNTTWEERKSKSEIASQAQLWFTPRKQAQWQHRFYRVKLSVNALWSNHLTSTQRQVGRSEGWGKGRGVLGHQEVYSGGLFHRLFHECVELHLVPSLVGSEMVAALKNSPWGRHTCGLQNMGKCIQKSHLCGVFLLEHVQYMKIDDIKTMN